MNPLKKIANKVAGAWGVSAVLPGKFDENRLRKEYKKMVELDRVETGTDAYSGSWKSLPSLKINSIDIIENKEKAEDYCLDRSEKWYYSYAVRFYADDNLKKLEQKLKYEQEKFKIFRRKILKKLKLHVRDQDLIEFPLAEILVNKGADQGIIDKVKKNNDTYNKKIDKIIPKLKALREKSKTNWMIAGWAAS